MVNSIKMIETIKQLCKENDIKISDLEEQVGLSKGNLSRWAKSCPAAIITLSQIADTLNTSVDYILGTGHTHTVYGKNQTLNILISQTESRGVEWYKLSYTKSKKIPVIKCINELIYNSNVSAYETQFNNKHLIFVSYNDTKRNELYIENNNEFIIVCDDDSYAERLLYSINDEKQNILKEFFTIEE